MVRKWTGLAVVAALVVGGSAARAQAPSPVPAPPAAAGGKPAAVVNGEPIGQGEVSAVLNMVVAQQFKTQPATDAQRRAIWMEVVNMLIDDAVLRQYLTRCNLQVPPAEVEKQFNEVKANLAKTNPPRKLEDFYKETGQNEQQIKASILNLLRWGEYVKTRLKEEEVKKYYDTNREFFDKVMVHACHILIRVTPTTSAAEKQAALAKLTALRADILAGKIDFAEAAKKNSQCNSAPNGGDIGFIPRKMLVDEAFAKAAFALKPGEVSDVVQTDAGLHLIKCVERKPGEASDYTKIQEAVRECCVDDMRQSIISQERHTAKVEINPPW
jgi:peptidyl-prolyl cis-trans isomerase C